MIKIQEDYWTGTQCVENEVPWQTPASIHYLDKLLRQSDTVLEVGTGGSTLFFARRCRHVVAAETNAEWSAQMVKEIRRRDLRNVQYMLCPDQNDLESALKKLQGFSVISIDSVHGYDRSAFLRAAMSANLDVQTIILDNYGEQVLFPDHFGLSLSELIAQLPSPEEWRGYDFDDPHWCGKGTRILTRRQETP